MFWNAGRNPSRRAYHERDQPRLQPQRQRAGDRPQAGLHRSGAAHHARLSRGPSSRGGADASGNRRDVRGQIGVRTMMKEIDTKTAARLILELIPRIDFKGNELPTIVALQNWAIEQANPPVPVTQGELELSGPQKAVPNGHAAPEA